MNTSTIGNEQTLAALMRWRLLYWLHQHRQGRALDQAMLDLAPRLGLAEMSFDERFAWFAARAIEPTADQGRQAIEQLGVNAVATVFALEHDESVLLCALIQLQLDADLSETISSLEPAIGNGVRPHLRAIACMLGERERNVARMLSRRSPLARLGLVSPYYRANTSLDYRFEVRDALLEYCSDPARDLEALTRSYFNRCALPSLALDDYAHVSGIDRALTLLRLGQPGTHLLLYGPPGTGKTQLAHVLARELGRELYSVPCQDQDDEPIEHHARLTAFAQAQLVLGARKDALLLFDEVEDVIRSSNVARDGKHRAVSFKGWLHEQLEHAPLPSIWISNTLAGFDDAQLRRFACIIEVPIPGLLQRRALVERCTAGLNLGADALEGLSRRTDIAPAELRALAREASAAVDSHRGFEEALGARLRATGRARWQPRPATTYDLRFVRTEPALPELLEGMLRLDGARLLMSGPPGSGKTALAAHLAECLQRPLIVKRASDLLSPWLGETEQLLALAFDEAERDRGLLLLDEADSFLSTRHEGQARWERSQVNELLKQLEDYQGWFCAASNLPDALDPAVMRRFDFKFRFGWLELPARVAMLEDYLQRHGVVRELDTSALTRAMTELPYLLPGDLAAIRRRIAISATPPSDREVLVWLANDHALKPEARMRPIGFARVA